MKSQLAISALGLFLGIIRPTNAAYELLDEFTSDNFWNGFEFYSGADPTGGTVQYVDRIAANKQSLAGSLPNINNAVYMGVDHISQAPNGRASVRVSSTKGYDHGLFVVDILHMPGGICGTWPAFWLLGSGTWPANGEIDVVEGVNSNSQNLMTLHTSAGCSMNPVQKMTGNMTSTKCDSGGNDNTGCQVQDPSPLSYGNAFNQNGGGVFAVEWTSQQITIYFFPRNSTIPSDLPTGQSKANSAVAPNPANWPTPSAVFSGCQIDSHFQNMSMIFDTTFCGQWAGQQDVWSADSTCAAKAGTCADYVKSNPSAFADAYWAVNSVRVWQDS
ncbi:MAG: hypothetical protein LQ340_001462 [Diploschistes diacapsis]|nr:MAG: hypothetical protein LQ340_001462 [Diploschistes diacapsis]